MVSKSIEVYTFGMSMNFSRILMFAAVCILPFSPAIADEQKWVDYSEQGMAAYKKGNDAQAERLLAAAVEEARQFDPSDMRLARSLHNLATVYSSQSKWPQAESTLKEALAVKEKALGATNAEVARTLNNLGVVYFNQYEYKQAEACYKRVLAIDQKDLSATHPERITSRENYALLLRRTGRDKEAAQFEAGIGAPAR
jgi:tetratricopeptide (TPR) repeat protein